MSSGRGEALGPSPNQGGEGDHINHVLPPPPPLTPFMPTDCLGPERSGALRIFGSGVTGFLAHGAHSLRHMTPNAGDARHLQLDRDTGYQDLEAGPWGSGREAGQVSPDRRQAPRAGGPHTSTLGAPEASSALQQGSEE